MVYSRIDVPDLIHSLKDTEENGALVDFIQENYNKGERPSIKFKYCDDKGLIEYLGLETETFSEQDAKDEWGLYDESEILVLKTGKESIKDLRKSELVEKIMKLELEEIELMLKPHAEKLNLVLHDHYFFKLRTENALKP